MNAYILKRAIEALCDVAKNELSNEVHPKELEDIIFLHATGAAIAAMASGWFPGAGSVVAFGIGVTFVGSMYIRLGNTMGITFGKGLIRAVASAVVADLAAYIATLLTVSAAVSFIPFFGNMSASMLTAIANFVCVYLAALIFVKMLSALMRTGKDVSKMTEAELVAAIKHERAKTDLEGAMKEAKSQFKQAKANGDLNRPGFTPAE